MKQRKFEYLKPFFVKQAKERDRKSCLCRKHVKMKIVFTACMKFRKAALKNSDQSIPVPKTVTECVNLTLCSKEHGASYHDIKCLERESVPPVVLMPLICLQKKRVKKGQYIGHIMNLSPLENSFPMAKRKRRSP